VPCPERRAASLAPAVELGWRLAQPFWGRGIATEAAAAAMELAFGVLGLSELLAYTAAANERSRRVMERLGMRRDPAEDFEHPSLASGHRLARHVLYRAQAPPPDISSEDVRALHQHSRP
jgi:RimJ/RimL family protein N-acetyltransferase